MHITARPWPCSTALPVVAGLLLLSVPATHAEDAVPAAVPGERLPSTALDAGVVEGWDVVRERMANLPDDWDPNPRDRGDAQGTWVIPGLGSMSRAATSPYAMNKWGDASMGIDFGERVTVRSVRILGQGGGWAKGVRVVGYRDGVEVAATAWHAPLTAEATLVALELEDVDRVIFEAQPVYGGAGWYGIDDLSFERAASGESIVVSFDELDLGTPLTGSGHAGLTWETGTGDFTEADAIHAPLVPPGFEEPGGGDAPGMLLGGETGTLPVLGQTFQGIVRGEASSSSYPPDTCGAIGTDHYVVVINRAIAVHSRFTGSRLEIANLGAFLPGSNGDPRVVFDQFSNRWIVLVTDFSTRIYLAVSTTESATGDWYKTSFEVSLGSDAGRWPDYPTLGVDEDGIYTASYMVGSPARMSIFAIEKAPLVASPPSLGVVTAFRGLPWEGAMHAMHDYDGDDGQWVISRSGSQLLRLRRIAGDITNPSLEGPFTVSIPDHDAPPLAPALGSSIPLNTVGPRLMNAMRINGRIWTAHTITVDGRAACRWYEIDDASRTLVQHGTISDPVRHYFFPSIAANALGDAVIGFSGSHAAEYAGAWYTGRRVDDLAGHMAPAELLREGTAPQNNIDGSGRNRWGDYSLSTLDPLDATTVWTIQEYAHANDVWGTQVAELRRSAAPANDYCQTTEVASVGATPFVTTGAGTDGPDEPDCGGAIESDVWWKFFAPCTGTVTIALCDADFDTRIAVYRPCPVESGAQIACNDDACGTRSEVVFAAEAGQGFRIRVGGAPGQSGSGVMQISCVPDEPECPSDIDGDGTVGVSDLLAVLGGWGDGGDADVNGDGVVDVADLLLVLADWGDC